MDETYKVTSIIDLLSNLSRLLPTPFQALVVELIHLEKEINLSVKVVDKCRAESSNHRLQRRPPVITRTGIHILHISAQIHDSRMELFMFDLQVVHESHDAGHLLHKREERGLLDVMVVIEVLAPGLDEEEQVPDILSVVARS